MRDSIQWGMLRLLCQLLLVAVGLIQSPSAWAYANSDPRLIELSSVRDSIRTDSFVTTLEDCSGTLGIEAVKALALAGRFVPTGPEGPSFGYTTCVYWLRLSFSDRGPQQREWLLRVDDPRINRVALYQPEGHSWELGHSGTSIKLADRPVYSRYAVFPLNPVDAAPRTIYLRMQTNDVTAFSVSIVAREALYRGESDESFAMGLYFGVLLSTIILNAFVFLRMRDWTYLTCLVAILSYAAFQAVTNAVDLMYLWPDHPNWHSYAIPITCGLSIASYTLFSWFFLDMEKRSRAWRWIPYLLVGIGLLIACISLLGKFSLAGMLGSYASPAALLGVAVLSIIAWRDGCAHAKYSIVAGVLQTSGVLLDGLSNLAILPMSPLVARLDLVTSALFMFTMTLALAGRFESLRRERNVAEHAAAELSRATVEARLQALQARINPHFLFNTLSSIAGLIAEAPERAEAVVLKLAKLFRYTLTATERGEKVRLIEELAIVRSYLEIEQERFGERLQFQIDIQGDVESVTLPGLTIQPLVENCVKHGLKNKRKHGQIVVRASVREDHCYLVVEDNGVGMSALFTHNGHGLASVQNRLALAYGEAARMRLTNHVGLRVEIELPVGSVG